VAWTVTSTQDSVREIGHLTHGIARNRTPVREIGHLTHGTVRNRTPVRKKGHLTHGQRHNECPVRGKRHFTHGTLSQDIQKSGCRATRLRRTGYGCQWESGAGVPGVHQPTLQLDAPVVDVRKDAVLDAADVLVEGAAGLAALGAGRHQIGAGNLGGLKHRLVGD
jgi:hypothetical protein